MPSPVYIEQDCTFEHEGRTFKAGGAIVTKNYAIGYLGRSVETGGPLSILNWHGEYLGEARIIKAWRTPRSFISTEMYQVEARIDGNTYTGRCAGIGMLWRGRVTAASLRQQAEARIRELGVVETIAESPEIRCQNVGRHVWVAGNAENCRRCGISWAEAHGELGVRS